MRLGSWPLLEPSPLGFLALNAFRFRMKLPLRGADFHRGLPTVRSPRFQRRIRNFRRMTFTLDFAIFIHIIVCAEERSDEHRIYT